MANFNAAAVRFGLPGVLMIAPIGTAEPADYSSAWGTGWYPMGYTDEGSAINYEISTDNVEVAEELDVLRRVTTGRDASIEFALAEVTLRNLNAAFNGGVVLGEGQDWEFEPPALGKEKRVMLGWDAYPDVADNDLRFIFRKCLQGGTVTMENRKGVTKQTIAVTFQLEKPDPNAGVDVPIMKIMGSETLNPDDTTP